jgi:N-acetylglutamate synthase-like GNAT family acetyltransferase
MIGAETGNATAPLIRPATEGDILAVEALIREAGDVFGFVRRVVLAQASATGGLLVAQSPDGGVVGAVRFHHRRDKFTTIHDIVVSRAGRRQGVGRLLVQAVHDGALACGQQALRAKCPVDALANGFYRATGWERTGIEEGRSRSLAIWHLPVRAPVRQRVRPTFYLSLTGEAGGIRGIQERWDRDGAAVGRTDPFAHVTFTPVFMNDRAVDTVRALHETRGTVAMADSGAYQVQMGRGRHSELLEKLVDLYPRLTWVDRFVLPDHVPHSSDSPGVVEEKVEESIRAAADLLRRLPEEFAPRMIGVVHGRTLQQIGRCVRAYHQMGVRSIAFGSFGTSGRMLSVNQVSAQSIRLLHGAQDMARVRGMSVHVLGIGSPRYLGALRAADVWPDSFDSAGWWKAGAFGNIFFPDSKQLLITMMEGITATPAGAAMLRDKSGHECTYCADIEPLRRDRMGRILHNLAAMIDMVKLI